jgi:hypothetical protein
MLAQATVPLFLLGMTLVIAAIVCQLLELQNSNRTISLEINDIMREDIMPGRHAG